MFAGFSVDLGRWYYYSDRVQTAADAAAKAAVVNLPDITQADATAKTLASRNGFTDGSPTSTKVTTTRKGDSALEVKVCADIDNVFLKVVGMSSQKVCEVSTADFNKPVLMGAREGVGVLGNQPADGTQFPTPSAQNYWLSVSGPRTAVLDGDPIQADNCYGAAAGGGFPGACSKQMSGSSANTDSCLVSCNIFDASTWYNVPNADYSSDGYYFTVTVDTPPANQNLQVQLYDPEFYDTGVDCDTSYIDTNGNPALGLMNDTTASPNTRFGTGAYPTNSFCAGDDSLGATMMVCGWTLLNGCSWGSGGSGPPIFGTKADDTPGYSFIPNAKTGVKAPAEEARYYGSFWTGLTHTQFTMRSPDATLTYPGDNPVLSDSATNCGSQSYDSTDSRGAWNINLASTKLIAAGKSVYSYNWLGQPLGMVPLPGWVGDRQLLDIFPAPYSTADILYQSDLEANGFGYNFGTQANGVFGTSINVQQGIFAPPVPYWRSDVGVANAQRFMNAFHNWVNFCNVTPTNSPDPNNATKIKPGQYLIQVQTGTSAYVCPQATERWLTGQWTTGLPCGKGQNNFSIRAKWSGGSTSGIKVSAMQSLPIMQNLSGSGQANLDIAQIYAGAKQRVLRFELFDPGDAAQPGTIELHAPTEASSFQADCLQDPVYPWPTGITVTANASGPGCTISGVQKSTTDGRRIVVRITLPPSTDPTNPYTCNGALPAGCFWYASVNYPGASTDKTQWKAAIEGDPVRIIN